MKKTLLILLAAFLAMPAFSQDLLIRDKEGKEQSLNLDNLRKLTFEKGNLVATLNDGSATSYILSSISKMLFSDNTAVEGIIADAVLPVSVYDLSGRVIVNDSSASTESVIGDLPKGIYLLRTGGKTIKIIK
ncbi:MAG: T9SS type A sorting domain-containing protein [Bacteroidaceae bacterium]|nr:T9SS type A sorting domain-containing protein [Bacteroidaceae bacterium]MBO7588308.1 T9SS type A sorting domain-containing protein [Bacteroidaceae bacterium]